MLLPFDLTEIGGFNHKFWRNDIPRLEWRNQILTVEMLPELVKIFYRINFDIRNQGGFRRIDSRHIDLVVALTTS